MLDVICIQEFSSRHMAEHARSILEAEGVVAMVEADDVGGMRPHLAYTGGVRLLVRAEDEGRARTILRDLETA